MIDMVKAVRSIQVLVDPNIAVLSNACGLT